MIDNPDFWSDFPYKKWDFGSFLLNNDAIIFFCNYAAN